MARLPRIPPAYAALAVGVFCIGTSAIFVKLAGVPGVVSAFYRVFIALLALLPLGWVQREQVHLNHRAWGLIALSSLFFTGDLVLWNTSILLTTAATATLLANNAPLWVGLGALLIFRERLPLVYWIGLLVALAGMTVIVGGDALSELRFNLGDLLAIAASFLYAGYMLTTQKARRHFNTLSLNLLTMATCSLILLPLTVLSGTSLAGFSLQVWLALLGLGLVPQFLGWLAINYALGHLPAARVSVTLLGQSAVTAILGVLLLGEALSPAVLVGGTLVLTGIYLVNQRRQASH